VAELGMMQPSIGLTALGPMMIGLIPDWDVRMRKVVPRDWGRWQLRILRKPARMPAVVVSETA